LLIILFSDLISFLLIADYRIGELIFLEFLVFILVGQSRAGWSSRSDRCVFSRFKKKKQNELAPRAYPQTASVVEQGSLLTPARLCRSRIAGSEWAGHCSRLAKVSRPTCTQAEPIEKTEEKPSRPPGANVFWIARGSAPCSPAWHLREFVRLARLESRAAPARDRGSRSSPGDRARNCWDRRLRPPGDHGPAQLLGIHATRGSASPAPGSDWSLDPRQSLWSSAMPQPSFCFSVLCRRRP
jgi:hypothetical protein